MRPDFAPPQPGGFPQAVACIDLPSLVGEAVRGTMPGWPPTQHLRHVIGQSLAAELVRAGWTQVPDIEGASRRFRSGTIEIAVDQALDDLFSAKLTEEQWRDACTQTGIAHLPVALVDGGTSPTSIGYPPPGSFWPAPEGVTAAPPVQPSMPYAHWVPTTTPKSDTSLVVRVLTVIAAVIGGIFVLGIAAAIFTPSFVHRRQSSRTWTSGTIEMKADGKSNLPGGLMTVHYKKANGQFETAKDANKGAGPHDGADWGVTRWTKHGRSFLDLQQYIFEPPVSGTSTARFIDYQNTANSRFVGHPVTYRVSKLHGRDAYVWDYEDQNRTWHHEIWIPGPVNTFRITCSGAVGDYDDLRPWCLSAIRSVEFANGA